MSLFCSIFLFKYKLKIEIHVEMRVEYLPVRLSSGILKLKTEE